METLWVPYFALKALRKEGSEGLIKETFLLCAMFLIKVGGALVHARETWILIGT